MVITVAGIVSLKENNIGPTGGNTDGGKQDWDHCHQTAAVCDSHAPIKKKPRVEASVIVALKKRERTESDPWFAGQLNTFIPRSVNWVPQNRCGETKPRPTIIQKWIPPNSPS